MTLRELEATFLAFEPTEGARTYRRTTQLAEADGLLFLCPVCFHANGNSAIGTHSVICWRPRVPLELSPGPGRWEFTGTGLEDLTLVAGSSSIQLLGGCNAHFFVRFGRIEPA